jgi:c-di-GMP-binding flagellar brake protein YcgR
MDKTISFASEGRRSPRLKNKLATTHFGEVFDLSPGGMKVFRKSSQVLEPGDQVTVELKCESLSAEVTVRVARRECAGFHRHIYGLEFIELHEELREKVMQLVKASCEPCAAASCWVAA